MTSGRRRGSSARSPGPVVYDGPMPNNNPKDVMLGVESTLTASPSMVSGTCLKEVVIGMDFDPGLGSPIVRIYLADFASPVADTVSYERGYGVVVEV
jgi:hypothetical protein